MDNVHKKRLETMRRKKEAASALLGTPGVTKSPGPVGSAKQMQKIAGTPKRRPSDQPSRFLDGEPTSGVLAAKHEPNGRGPENDDRPSAPAADVEMRDVAQGPHRDGSAGSELECEKENSSIGLTSTGKAADRPKTASLSPAPPKAIETTRSGRPYTKYQGMCSPSQT